MKIFWRTLQVRKRLGEKGMHCTHPVVLSVLDVLPIPARELGWVRFYVSS